MTSHQHHRRSQHGFTLVELLVVISILGILAAIVVFAVSGIGDKGQSNACKADGQTVYTAIEAYRAKAGHSATDDPDMATLVSDGDLRKASTNYPTITYTSHVPSLPASSTCSAD